MVCFLYQYANTSLWYVAGHKIGIVNNIVGSRYHYHLILIILTQYLLQFTFPHIIHIWINLLHTHGWTFTQIVMALYLIKKPRDAHRKQKLYWTNINIPIQYLYMPISYSSIVYTMQPYRLQVHYITYTYLLDINIKIIHSKITARIQLLDGRYNKYFTLTILQ